MERIEFWVAIGSETVTLIAGKEDNQMQRKQVFRIILGVLAIMTLTLVMGSSAWAAGKYKTLHTFKQTGVGGDLPLGGLTFDAAGNLYGTTEYGGAHGYGTVFELTPNGDGSWV